MDFYFKFAYGFASGTRLYGGPESIKCKTSLDLSLQTAYTDLPATLKDKKGVNKFTVVRQTMVFPTQLKPMADSCMVGFSGEADVKLLRYSKGYPTMWDFMDTFAFNFGLLYDSFINTVMDLFEKGQNPDAQTSSMYTMLGYGLGNILYLIFYPE